jgi:hypothetical protein
MAHEKEREKDKRKQMNINPVNAPWCQDFGAAPGQPVNFTGVPAGGSISQAGAIWPFCKADGTPLPTPWNFSSNIQIIICSNMTPGAIVPFNANPCAIQAPKNVTIN